MKRIILGLLIANSWNVFATEVEVDSGQNSPIFQVDHKTVSAVEAERAYKAGFIVNKCTPVKGVVDQNGKSITGLKCKAVKRVMNAKTGNETWKSL